MKERIRILRIINRFNLGGPTYNAAYLTRYMPADDYETLLIGGQKDVTEDSSQFILNNLGIKPRVIDAMRRSPNPFLDISAYRQISAIIETFKPHVVHTHASKPGTLGRYAAYRHNVPAIVHTFHGHVFHSYFNPAITRFYQNLERQLARISHQVVAISNLQKHELSEVYGIASPEKISVVPLGFDLDRFRENQTHKRERFRATFGIAPDTVCVGIVGRLVPVKNHELFLRAVAAVRKNTPHRVVAFIIGDGERKEQLIAYANALGLTCSHGPSDTTDVIFTSWIKNIDYANAGMDIIALSSHNEGTPVSLIEAQASGRAIVSANVGGIADVVLPNQTALLSRAGDEEQFVHNLQQLINDVALRERLGAAGWPFVRERFTYQRLCGDMDALYRKLLNRPH